jgi:hypothetical protein
VQVPSTSPRQARRTKLLPRSRQPAATNRPAEAIRVGGVRPVSWYVRWTQTPFSFHVISRITFSVLCFDAVRSASGQKHALPQRNGKGRFTPISGHATPPGPPCARVLNTAKRARGLGRNPELPNILQNAPHHRLRGAAHGSICVQEGQPRMRLLGTRLVELHRGAALSPMRESRTYARTQDGAASRRLPTP